MKLLNMVVLLMKLLKRHSKITSWITQKGTYKKWMYLILIRADTNYDDRYRTFNRPEKRYNEEAKDDEEAKDYEEVPTKIEAEEVPTLYRYLLS
jgi:hypothetical protein